MKKPWGGQGRQIPVKNMAFSLLITKWFFKTALIWMYVIIFLSLNVLIHLLKITYIKMLSVRGIWMKRITNWHVFRKDSAKFLKCVFKSESALHLQLLCSFLGVWMQWVPKTKPRVTTRLFNWMKTYDVVIALELVSNLFGWPCNWHFILLKWCSEGGVSICTFSHLLMFCLE